VALEIDAVSESLDGARIEIRGQARVLMTGGTELRPGFDDEMLRARQSRIITWGVNSKDFIQQDAQSVA